MKKNIIVLLVVFIILSCTKSSTSPDDSLAAPSNFTLEQIDLESIQLTWQDNSSAEEGFRFDRKIGGNEWEENYQTVSENTTMFIDSDLQTIGNYSYRISTYSNDDFSDTVEASINFLYDDVHSFQSVASQNNIIEFFEFQFALLDSNGIYVQRDYDVWFKLLGRPEGTNLNNILYNTTDSLLVRSVEGIASVTMYAGNQSGIASLKCYVYNSNNEEISITKSNINVQGLPPEIIELSNSGINSGENLGNGHWEIEVSALILDSSGNPVYDGTAVYFSLPDDPEWASIYPTGYIGNVNANGDSIPGVVFTRLGYDGAHTNDVVIVRLETGLGDLFEGELVLPIQYPMIDIVAVPLHIDWTQYNNPDWRDHTAELSPYVEITIIDGQNNLIANQDIIFSSTLGVPVLETQLNMSPSNPSFTAAYEGITDENGHLLRYFRFYKYECPPPIPAPPGTTTGTIIAQIFGTNISNQVTIILRRYVD